MKNDYDSAKTADDLLVAELKKQNPAAFKKLFREYGEDLLIFTFTVLNSRVLTEMAMRKLIFRIMSKGKAETITLPLYSFLLKETKEICSQVSSLPAR